MHTNWVEIFSEVEIILNAITVPHCISYRPTDLSLLKGFSKKFSFEDF